MSDEKAQSSFRSAIRQVVKAGDTVVDLGTGTGIHSVFACKAGARSVYAIDEDRSALALARKILPQNRCDGRVRVLRGHSSRIRLPEKADLIVTHLAWGDLLIWLPEAAQKFLKEDGRTIPQASRLFFVPVTWRAGYGAMVDFWRKRVQGIDFSPLREMSLNSLQPANFAPRHFLSEPAGTPMMVYRTRENIPLRWSARFRIERPGVLHGMGAWFELVLTDTVRLSLAPPLRLPRSIWGHYFLPIEEPRRVSSGDGVVFRIHVAPQGKRVIWSWGIELEKRQPHVRGTRAELRQSTGLGYLSAEASLNGSRRRTRQVGLSVIS